MKTTRKATKYFKIVNISNNEITVLDEIFHYKDGMKGATGNKFEPISKERYDEITNMGEDEIADYLIDQEFELPEQYKRGGFIEWAEAFGTEDKLSLFFDLSYQSKWVDLREQSGLTEDEAYIFTCSGGGRCFDKNFKGNRNQKLCRLIREIEA